MFLRLFAIVLLLLGAVAGVARAEENEDVEAARGHFSAGRSYYDDGRFEDALREFREAYRKSQRPALLYNIARCHERLDRPRDAAAALREYLVRSPNADDRAQIEAKIAELESTSGRKRVWTWVSGGVGLGLLGGSLASYLVARSTYLDLRAACEANGGVCPVDRMGDRDRAAGLYYASMPMLA